MSVTDKQAMLMEYTRCASNPIHTIERYFETFDKTQEGFVPFKLFEIQKNLIKNYEEHRFNLVVKYRQAGISTVTAGYCAVKTVFAPKSNPERILILANKLETAIEFQSKILTFIKQLPPWVNVSFTKSAQKHVKLMNGSEIKAVATSPDALRGYTPTILILDEAAFIEGGQDLWVACLAAIGCLDESTLLITDNGIIELGDLIEDKEKLGFHKLTQGISVINKHNVLETPDMGYKSSFTDTYKIKTKYGHELTGSWKHPLIVNDNWVQMQNLKVGDSISFSYNQNLFGNDNIIDLINSDIRKDAMIGPYKFNLLENLDVSYLMGLFLAEGHFDDKSIWITNGDKEIQERLLLDGFGTKKFNRVKNRKYHFYLTSKYYKEIFHSVGLTRKRHASEKEIPKQILRTSREVIIKFIQGMFDGDGCANKKIIKYSTTSKKIAEQLQLILLNFGIRSRIKYSETKTSKTSVVINKDHICKIYELFILEGDINKFYETIGFGLSRKKHFKIYHENKINKRKINISKDLILNLLNENGIKSSEYEMKYRYLDSSKRYNKGYLTYHAINKLINSGLSGLAYDKIMEIYNHSLSYFTDDIVEITKSEGWTYDLHLPKTNSFNSNGFISHNTGGKAFLISTPNGLDEIYYEAYEGSLNNTNSFYITHLNWWEDPRFGKNLKLIKTKDVLLWIQLPKEEQKEYDVIEDASQFSKEELLQKFSEGYRPYSSWYENMCREMNLNRRLINQELECVVGDTYITIKNKKTNLIEEIKIEDLYDKL